MVSGRPGSRGSPKSSPVKDSLGRERQLLGIRRPLGTLLGTAGSASEHAPRVGINDKGELIWFDSLKRRQHLTRNGGLFCKNGCPVGAVEK